MALYTEISISIYILVISISKSILVISISKYLLQAIMLKTHKSNNLATTYKG